MVSIPFLREYNHYALQPLYYPAMRQCPDSWIHITGTWTWAYALEWKKNKQMIKLIMPHYSEHFECHYYQ